MSQMILIQAVVLFLIKILNIQLFGMFVVWVTCYI